MSLFPVSAVSNHHGTAGGIRAADSSPTGTSSGTGTSSTATDYSSMFMQLLATELQSQDPTQPMDPTTMVTQMVQINQLSDVAGIYSILQGASGTTATANSARSTTPSSGMVHAAAHPANPAASHTTPKTAGGQ